MKITKAKETEISYKNIELREPTVSDEIQAELLCNKPTGRAHTAALISLIATFDGKKLTYEDVLLFPSTFFLDLMSGMAGIKMTDLEKLLSVFAVTVDSASKLSKK